MGLFKKGAIKRVTRRRTRDLLNAIGTLISIDTDTNDANKIFKDAVLQFMRLTQTFTGLRFQIPFDIEGATGVEICQLIIIQLVVHELSYDRSMGSWEDIQLILETFDQECKRVAAQFAASCKPSNSPKKVSNQSSVVSSENASSHSPTTHKSAKFLTLINKCRELVRQAMVDSYNGDLAKLPQMIDSMSAEIQNTMNERGCPITYDDAESLVQEVVVEGGYATSREVKRIADSKDKSDTLKMTLYGTSKPTGRVLTEWCGWDYKK